MYSYWVYGFGLSSNFQLPALLSVNSAADSAADSVPDVTLQINKETTTFPSIPNQNEAYINFSTEETLIFHPKAGLFILRDGREVVIKPVQGADLEFIRLYILGTVLTVLLYQRGQLVLHGSAIAIGDGVVGFIGDSGWGKSSLAAALYCRGRRILSDDAIVIDSCTGELLVHPGYPHLKISTSVATCLEFDAAAITAVHPESDEISYRVSQNFLNSPLPLKQLYILEKGSKLSIEPVSAYEALRRVMMNSLPTMWLCQQTPQQFLQCTKLVNSVPFYRLERSQDLTSLPSLAEMVEAHVLSNVIGSLL